MIRISPAFYFNAAYFNAAGCKNWPRAEIFGGVCAGGEVAAGNRPFTMPREWGCKARVKELKRCMAPRPRRHLSVRLSGL
jgi:hypothetical protein